MYWAEALAAQEKDDALKTRFAEVARALAADEATILEELLEAQGEPVTLGGYYHPDEALVTKTMRPSATFNAIIDAM